MTRLERGVVLFNDGEFFRCHEVWEEEWTSERGPRRIFLQSLIHIAVGLYHWQRGNFAGAGAQLGKGLGKLAGYLPGCDGIDTGQLYRDVAGALGCVEGRGECAGFRIQSTG